MKALKTNLVSEGHWSFKIQQQLCYFILPFLQCYHQRGMWLVFLLVCLGNLHGQLYTCNFHHHHVVLCTDLYTWRAGRHRLQISCTYVQTTLLLKYFQIDQRVKLAIKAKFGVREHFKYLLKTKFEVMLSCTKFQCGTMLRSNDSWWGWSLKSSCDITYCYLLFFDSCL